MIRRALELQEALDIYALKLHRNGDDFDQETYNNDYLSPREQKALRIIKDQLALLFYLTKELEDNIDLSKGAGKVSYGLLQEVLPILEEVLDYFEGLEKQAKNSDFNNYLGI